jgi:hypothetical protein
LVTRALAGGKVRETMKTISNRNGVEVVELAPNAKGSKIRSGKNGDRDTVYADPSDLMALDAYRVGRSVRRIGPLTYALWK